MKTDTILLLGLVCPAVLGRPTKRVDFGGNFNNGDGRIAAKAGANSIECNVDIRRGEQTTLALVTNLFSKPVVDILSFFAAKQQLLASVNTGNAVRSNHQLITTPDGKSSTADLPVVSTPMIFDVARPTRARMPGQY